MTDRKVLWLILGALVIALIGLLLFYFEINEEGGEMLFQVGLGVGQLLGFTLLYHHWSLGSSIYWRLIKGAVGVLIIGILFKIQHWPGANLMLVVSCSLILVFYFLHFLNKKARGHLEVMKLLWVSTTIVVAVLRYNHLIVYEFNYLPLAIFWLTILDFALMEFGIISKASNQSLDD